MRWPIVLILGLNYTMARNINRLGSSFAWDSAIGPPNQGLGRYAQARVDNTVARAVRRHAEALRVDGNPVHLWIRRNGGLICTCRAPAKTTVREQIEPVINQPTSDDLRQPPKENRKVTADDIVPIEFRVIHVRRQSGIGMPFAPVPPEFEGVDTSPPNLDGEPDEHLNSIAPGGVADNAQTDAQLARMLSEGGVIYGGDQTACGICFGTGRTHGYEYFSGKRLVLDASNEWPYNLTGAADIDVKQHPAKFSIDAKVDSTVEWTVDLPAFTDGWQVVAARNNLKPANHVQIQWQLAGVWQPLTLDLLLANEGIDRTRQKIRVISDGTLQLGETTEFTHVELTYITAPPMLAQCGPLPLPTNFDLLDPDLTIDWEMLAGANDIPRESVFQDSKFRLLWKIMDITPKVTSTGQVFMYTVSARNVKQGEQLLALTLLLDPFVEVNYRGLERTQGGITQEYWPESEDVPNDFILPQDDENQYDIDRDGDSNPD
jgi:hypothetical protein